MANWVASTKTIDNASMSGGGFASGDANKSIMFQIGTTWYITAIKTITDTDTVIVHNRSGLPTSNGTIASIVMPDTGETHVYQDYLDAIGTKIMDIGAKPRLPESPDRERILRAAVTQYGKDRPIYIATEVTGDASDLYSLSTILGSHWVPGHTHIKDIEYPISSEPRTYLPTNDWEVQDDGSVQDFTNQKLKFYSITPQTTEKFIIRTSLQLYLSSATGANFPDTEENFFNITTLGAVYGCLAIASYYGSTADDQISSEIAQFGSKTESYLSMARQYKREYNRSVWGSENPKSDSGPAIAIGNLENLTSQRPRRRFLTHR